MSLLNIFMSIPIALVIYTYVARVTYFSTLHISVFIIIIGIGSDDIFVFHDFWVNTFKIKALENRPILRLSLAFRQASRAMAVTSITSAVTFSSCIFSDIMPIQSFGVFATIIVSLVFLQTIFVQPFTYYIYVRFLMHLCSKNKPKLDMSTDPLVEQPEDSPLFDYSEYT